jgi:glucosamine-6-phosphate deaminase
MEVIIVADPSEAAQIAADTIEHLITRKPAAVIGLATGSSPVKTYAEVIERHANGRLSFAEVSAFLLDEYIGLPRDHPETYRNCIRRHFTDHIDIDTTRVSGPDGTADDVPATCVAYEAAIAAAGGVDLQILGIGADGHVGFNEPISSLGSRTRVKTLNEQTRKDNARFFESVDDVPRHVITQGIATILEARHLVLIATGGNKATPIAQTVEGPLTAMVPASAIQLHPHATVIVDEDAAEQLTLADYYRQTYAAKPAWQVASPH